MKNLVLATFALVASAQISCASLFDDLVGKWKVTNTRPGYSITTVFKKVGSNGLKRTSTIVIPGLANAKDVTNYNSNGTVNGTIKRGGVIQVTLEGTWRVSGSTLIEDVELTGVAYPGGATQKTKVKKVNINKLSTVSTVNGTRTTGTLRRVRP